MEKKPVVIFGSGPEARIALDIFNSLDVFPYGVITDDKKMVGTDLNDVSVFGESKDEEVKAIIKDENTDFIVTWGEIKTRKKIYQAVAGLAKRPAVNCTHGSVVISPYASVGFGNLMNAGVVINANAIVGDNNIFHTHASVEPDATVGNYCTISAGVRIAGNAVLADDIFVGTGAIIYPGVKVGKGALIGAGAVVLRDVKARSKVFGNPAEVLK